MLTSDKSQLKGNIEQIGFQSALKTSKTGRLFHTVGPVTEKARSPNVVLVLGDKYWTDVRSTVTWIFLQNEIKFLSWHMSVPTRGKFPPMKNPGLYLTGGVRGVWHPQEVVDPQKVLQNLFGGVDSNPPNNPHSIFLLNQYIYVTLYNYTPLTNLATSMSAIVARSIIASRNSDPPVKIWQIQPWKNR